MIGALYSLVAGLLIGLQGIFNARISDKVGLLETTVVIHIVGLIFAVTMTVLFGTGNLRNITEVNKLYIVGGTFGVIIIASIVTSIGHLGAAKTVAIVLIAQLLISVIIDSFGLFGAEKLGFQLTKLIGLIVMIAGIFIFNSKG